MTTDQEGVEAAWSLWEVANGIAPDAATRAREHKLAQDMWAARGECDAQLAEREAAKAARSQQAGSRAYYALRRFASLLRQEGGGTDG